MRTIICKDYEDLSLQGAKLVYSQIIMKPNCVLGLATGSTPIGMYEKLVDMYNDGELDFEETIFNFSKTVVNTMEVSQQKSVFGKAFESYDECYDYLENNVPTLRYDLEIFVNQL